MSDINILITEGWFNFGKKDGMLSDVGKNAGAEATANFRDAVDVGGKHLRNTALGTAGILGAAGIAKAAINRTKRPSTQLARDIDKHYVKAKKYVLKNQKKVAIGGGAALGAALGTKALLHYLKRKKTQ